MNNSSEVLPANCSRDELDTPTGIFVSVLVLIGILGTGLNILVIVSVSGNARLGTTVNKLLIWICSYALLESTLGIAVKSLVIGRVIQMFSGTTDNELICKSILVLPFIFCNTTIVFWTTVSVYRLYLVISSARGGTHQVLRTHMKYNKAQIILPAVAVTLGTLTGMAFSVWAEPFVIFRVCRGKCDNHDPETQTWASAFLIFVASLYHLPSGLCYVIIYCYLKTHQKKSIGSSLAGTGAMAMTLVKVPPQQSMQNAKLTSATSEMNLSSSQSSFQRKRLRRNFWSQWSVDESTSKSVEDVTRTKPRSFIHHSHAKFKPPSPFDEGERFRESMNCFLSGSLRLDDEGFLEGPGLIESTPKSSIKKHPGRQRRASSVITMSDLSHSFRRKVTINDSLSNGYGTRFQRPRSRRRNKGSERNGFVNTFGNTLTVPGQMGASCALGPLSSSQESSFSQTASAPPETSFQTISQDSERIRETPAAVSDIIVIKPDEVTCETTAQPTGAAQNECTVRQRQQKRRRRKHRKKNIISAKLGFVFLILSIVFFLMIHFGYSKVPENWQKKLIVRSFANCLVVDCVICVISPLMLLYGSRELRKAVKGLVQKSPSITRL